MSNALKMAKFETLVKDIKKAVDSSSNSVCKRLDAYYTDLTGRLGFNEDKECRNHSMRLIYDYESSNEYAKIIMENTSSELYEWDRESSKLDFKDERVKIEAAKELVRYCRHEQKREVSYNFIFWALFISTVDKSNSDDTISLICDFAKMLKITEDEIEDIIQVIKVIYHKGADAYKFKSTVVDNFIDVLKIYE